MVHLAILIAFLAVFYDIDALSDPELQLFVEGDDSHIAHPRLQTAEAVETLRKFFMMVGMGGDIILGRVDGTLAGPGETVHEFCSTGQAQSFWNVASHFYIAAGCSSCFCEPWDVTGSHWHESPFPGADFQVPC